MSSNINNPADEWDDWGSTPTGDTPQSEDIWNSTNQNNVENSNIWDSEQQDNWNDLGSQQDTVNNQQDIWGSQYQGTFIQQDTYNQSDFLPQDNITSQDYQNFDDSGDLTAQVQQQPVKFNFSPKKASLIIAGVLLTLALVLMVIDSIKISPKQNQQQPVQQTQQQDNITQQQTQSQPQSQPQTQQQSQSVTSQGSAVLVEVPDSMSVSYSGDIQEANGKVIDKKKYVQGHQILYCITINISFGSSSENVSYYCNYNSYNQVNVGDVVVISYQQVNDSYISVNAIQK